MSGLNFPNIVAGMIEGMGLDDLPLMAQANQISSDRAIEKRLDMILKGMKP